MYSLFHYVTVAAIFASSFAAAAEKTIPQLTGPVIDEMHLLNAEETKLLGDYILSQKDIVQMQVWITSLDGGDLEKISYRAASKWALGTEKSDNGLLMLVAPQEKRMRLEVGRGLEGAIPDILAGRILDTIARPNFRANQYYLGIQTSLEYVVALASKNPQSEKVRNELLTIHYSLWDRIQFGIGILSLLWIALSLIVSRSRYLRRSKYFAMGPGSIFGPSIWDKGSSGSGSSSSGGGSWSGGGGSFGGGGSSSSW
jgi:uncharacterized protein